MFLKVKRAAGKQYFALCESVRRDKKIVTKTVKSLGNQEKAFVILQSDYPEFLGRFYDIVGTKKCRDNICYGLFDKNENEFERCCYSGLNYMLIEKYPTYDAAVDKLNRRHPDYRDFYVIKEIPQDLILQDKKTYERRLIS